MGRVVQVTIFNFFCSFTLSSAQRFLLKQISPSLISHQIDEKLSFLVPTTVLDLYTRFFSLFTNFFPLYRKSIVTILPVLLRNWLTHCLSTFLKILYNLRNFKYLVAMPGTKLQVNSGRDVETF